MGEIFISLNGTLEWTNHNGKNTQLTVSYSKLTIETLVNDVSDVVLLFLLLTLNIFHIFFYCFYYWLCARVVDFHILQIFYEVFWCKVCCKWWVINQSHFIVNKLSNSTFRLTSLIYTEKFGFENPAIIKYKQCKQTERFSVIAKGSDYFCR